jgi:hypothetical protein
MQRKEALSLCQATQIDPQQPCGLDEVHKLQETLPAYRLCVFAGKKCNTECIFKGSYGPGRKNICLLLYEEHYYAIIYPEQAFGYNLVCEKCVTFLIIRGNISAQRHAGGALDPYRMVMNNPQGSVWTAGINLGGMNVSTFIRL